jgi:hypothetical protein
LEVYRRNPNERFELEKRITTASDVRAITNFNFNFEDGMFGNLIVCGQNEGNIGILGIKTLNVVYET